MRDRLQTGKPSW